MSFRFSSLGEYRFLNYVLIILWVSLMSVVVSLFPYVILMVSSLSFSGLIWLKVCHSSWYFLKNQLFFPLDFLKICFYFISFWNYMLAYLSLDRVTKVIFSSMYRYSRRLGMLGKIKMWIMFFFKFILKIIVSFIQNIKLINEFICWKIFEYLPLVWLM